MKLFARLGQTRSRSQSKPAGLMRRGTMVPNQVLSEQDYFNAIAQGTAASVHQCTISGATMMSDESSGSNMLILNFDKEQFESIIRHGRLKISEPSSTLLCRLSVDTNRSSPSQTIVPISISGWRYMAKEKKYRVIVRTSDLGVDGRLSALAIYERVSNPELTSRIVSTVLV